MQFLHCRRLVPDSPREQRSPQHNRHNVERLSVRLPPLAVVMLPAQVRHTAQHVAVVPVRLVPVQVHRVPTAPHATKQAEDRRASPATTSTLPHARERLKPERPIPIRAEESVLAVRIRDANRLLTDCRYPYGGDTRY